MNGYLASWQIPVVFFLGLLFSETVKNRWLVQQNQGEPVFQNKKLKKKRKRGGNYFSTELCNTMASSATRLELLCCVLVNLLLTQ